MPGFAIGLGFKRIPVHVTGAVNCQAANRALVVVHNLYLLIEPLFAH